MRQLSHASKEETNSLLIYLYFYGLLWTSVQSHQDKTHPLCPAAGIAPGC